MTPPPPISTRTDTLLPDPQLFRSLYLGGRQFLHRHSRPYYLLVKRMFAKAIELDPLYARAYAGIADCDSFLFLHYHMDVSVDGILATRSEEHTSELQSLMRISYAVFCLKKKISTYIL